MLEKTLKIATRQSPLALWQANYVKDRLQQLYPDLTIELVPMVTKGDVILDSPLAKIGGKGLFVKELENAPHRIKPKDVISGLARLDKLYNYCSSQEINIISIGHMHTLTFDEGEIEVDIGPIAYKNGKYFLFYPVFDQTFNQDKCDSDIKCSLDWKAAYDAFDFQLSGVMFYYPKTNNTFIAYRDISSIERLNFIANNVLKGIANNIYFPVREESSKCRFIPEISRTFTGK